MNKEEITEKVKFIIHDQLCLENGEIHHNSNIVDDLGADSLDEVEIVMTIEEEFDIEISDEEAEKIKTVQQTVAHIFGKI